jgi:hypothetical protein
MFWAICYQILLSKDIQPRKWRLHQRFRELFAIATDLVQKLQYFIYKDIITCMSDYMQFWIDERVYWTF